MKAATFRNISRFPNVVGRIFVYDDWGAATDIDDIDDIDFPFHLAIIILAFAFCIWRGK